MLSYRLLHTGTPVLADQQEFRFIGSLQILDANYITFKEGRPKGTYGARESRESVLSEYFDDDHWKVLEHRNFKKKCVYILVSIWCLRNLPFAVSWKNYKNVVLLSSKKKKQIEDNQCCWRGRTVQDF